MKSAGVYIETLGCKLNQAESETLARKFRDSGYSLTDAAAADIIVLNTCTVTHIADRKARHLIRMLKKLNPNAYLVVTGCYAERTGEEARSCGADEVVGNALKLNLPVLMSTAIKAARERTIGVSYAPESRVRSLIKIQDGCRNFCSYCIVPYLRREVACMSADQVIAEVKARTDEGYQEVVLTGTEIGSYQGGQTSLCGLLRRLLDETNISRIHLSSLQPHQITADLLSAWQDTRLIRHFHLALQSGCDTVLLRMQRRYHTGLFRQAVESIRSKFPDVSITTDIIVGFPGETEAEFAESYSFCESMDFSAIHVFNYSPRPGTSACGLPGKVNDRIKKERSRLMLELSATGADKFAARFIGQTRDVLWEGETKKGCGVYVGLTDNYLRTYVCSTDKLYNKIQPVRLTQLASTVVTGLLRRSTRGNHGELWGGIQS